MHLFARCLTACVIALLPMLARADATLPTKDIPGSSDPAWLKRYEGSYIVSYEHKQFDAVTFPASKLIVDPQSGLVDGKNNDLARAKVNVTAEGEYTRLVYVAPEGRSPLEVIRNYIDAIHADGGKLVYGCMDENCGGAMVGNDHGGGTQGLLEQLYPQKRVKDPNYSAGNCATTDDPQEQRYVLANMPDGNGGQRTLGVYVYTMEGDTYCTALKDRTGVLIVAIEPKAREDKMVTVTSDEMRKALETQGRIALYGIYFDSNKSQVKPESRATLEQIGNLMKQLPKLKLGIVGHTDDVGDDAANQKLSDRRANAVMTALVENYGIAESRLDASGAGESKPIADNGSEQGRAKNRRVELVKR